MVSESNITVVGTALIDVQRPLHERFRALFTLKNLGGKVAIDYISKGFNDPSALLKHELAYCLGQMQDPYAVPVLVRVLQDKKQEAMVRHEAGEALGAIGDPSVMEILEQYSKDSVVEVAETCQLAVERMKWLHNKDKEQENLSQNPYCSIDPAPPAAEHDISRLQDTLLNDSISLFDRYRAMFTLRNIGTSQCVLSLAEGLSCSSALFRHEIAYVLGQMQHEAAIPKLKEALQNTNENPMVRHECAEALGSIAKEECMDILGEYMKDSERVVKESCEVALDMYEHEKSQEFQYANGLSMTQKS